MSDRLYPFRFRPVYKDYVWGGDRIIRKYHRSEPAGVYAESWEISDHPDGMSVLTNGPLAGATLHELVQRFGPALLGRDDPRTTFPLIIKILDARARLSVQVHPGEETAPHQGGDPKTEMWYVLEADPNAGVYAGLQPGVDRAALVKSIEAGTVKDKLRFVPVKQGQVVFIPAGRIHALDAGCLMFEVQQRSNTTYRLYDWDRKGPDGRPRALHIEQALRAIRWHDDLPVLVSDSPPRRAGGNERRLVMDTPFFIVEHWRLAGPRIIPARRSGMTFQALFVVAGSLGVEGGGRTERAEAGSTILLPAELGACRWIPEKPGTEILCVTRP